MRTKETTKTQNAVFINPMTDFGFKRAFAQEDTKQVLISFLNALLEDEQREIADLTFKDREQDADNQDKKTVVLDLYCTDTEGREFIVEMQQKSQPYFVDRMLYYASRAIVNQGKKGKEYMYELTPVYVISFINFSLTGKSGKILREVFLVEKGETKQFTDKLKLFFIELPSFELKESECKTDFDKWIYVIKNMETLKYIPFKNDIEVLKHLEEVMRVTELDPARQDEYEASWKAYHDMIAQNAPLEEYEKVWREAAKKERKEGIAEGRAEGIKEGAKNTATRLKSIGLSIEQIAEATGLSAEEIKDL